MKLRLLALTLLASGTALVWAATASYAAYVFRMSVNTDKSVTIEWALGGTDVSQSVGCRGLLRRSHLAQCGSVCAVHD